MKEKYDNSAGKLAYATVAHFSKFLTNRSDFISIDVESIKFIEENSVRILFFIFLFFFFPL
jgi:hypothetical protein